MLIGVLLGLELLALYKSVGFMRAAKIIIALRTDLVIKMFLNHPDVSQFLERLLPIRRGSDSPEEFRLSKQALIIRTSFNNL